MRKLIFDDGAELCLSDEGVWSSTKWSVMAEELNNFREKFRQGYTLSMGDPLNYVLGQVAQMMGASEIQFTTRKQDSKQTDAVN